MYICSNCWVKSSYALYTCKDCWATDSFSKEVKKAITKTIKKSQVEDVIKTGNILKPKEVKSFNLKHAFIPLEDKELLRVFQWGICEWGVYLLAWNPGAWKSTLMAQIIHQVRKLKKVAYFSWEENEEQIYMRFQRLGVEYCDLYHTWNVEDIFATIEANKYDFVVIDSIQTCYSLSCEWVAGWISQIKTVSEMLTQFFKERKITAFIIGHFTKDGDVAWPKYLEHIVDAPIQLEWDKYWLYKFLKAKKNRFCSDDDVGIFEMTNKWLVGVQDFKDRVLKQFTKKPWNVLWVGIDNWRPVFVNIEVLITPSAFNYPQRNVIGYDKDRINLIVAIMEKYLWVSFQDKDIFINIPGDQSFKKDNGLDLAIVAAIYSSHTVHLFSDKVFFWEVTLMGKIRPATFQARRLKEAQWFDIVTYEEYKNDLDLVLNNLTNWWVAINVAKSMFWWKGKYARNKYKNTLK